MCEFCGRCAAALAACRNIGGAICVHKLQRRVRLAAEGFGPVRPAGSEYRPAAPYIVSSDGLGAIRT